MALHVDPNSSLGGCILTKRGGVSAGEAVASAAHPETSAHIAAVGGPALCPGVRYEQGQAAATRTPGAARGGQPPYYSPGKPPRGAGGARRAAEACAPRLLHGRGLSTVFGFLHHGGRVPAKVESRNGCGQNQ